MKHRLTAYLPLAALTLLAAWPLLRFGPPGDIDGPNHFYRFVELDWHLRHGDWYPRWFSDVHFGFGGPILNFYAPLSYYILVGLRFIVGSFSTTFSLGFALAIVVASAGMYLWAGRQFGSTVAGLTAAAAYAFTPYFYITALGRGSLPEVWGMALAPWLFWAVLRALQLPGRKTWLTLTTLFAILLITHSLSTLLLTPLVLIYGAVTVWRLPREGRPPRATALARAGLSLVQAAGLGAFFLLPFLLEAPNVQLERAKVFDYHDNFLPAAELFSPPVPYDPYYIANAAPRSLPWPQLGLALIALVSTFRSRRQADRLIFFSTLALSVPLIFIVFLTDRVSLPIWESLPIAYLIQFPWRLLSPATLLLAWLAGAGVAGLPNPKFRFPLAVLAISSMFLFSLTWTYHTPYQFPDPAAPLEVVRFEIADPQSAGTTGSREFLPAWVKELPAPDTLLQRYIENEIPARLAPLPDSVKLLEQRAALTATDIRYQAAEPFTATFYLFYFPGWAATLDGQPVAIHFTDPDGLITLALPAGQHRFRLALGPTRPQMVGTIISLLALASLFIPGRAPVPAAQVDAGPSTAEPLPAGQGGHQARPYVGSTGAPRVEVGLGGREARPYVGSTSAWAWVGLFAGLIGLRIAVFDTLETPFRRSEFGEIPNPISINFGNQLELIGFKYPDGPAVSAGSPLHLTLYWRAPRPVSTRYSTAVQLVDAYGNRVGQSDHYSPAGVPTPWWPAGRYARDEHLVAAAAGAPPGEYHIHVSVYSGGEDNNPATPLNILSGGSTAGLDYDLGAVTVSRGQPQPPGPLRLVSASLGADTLQVGDRLAFTALWNSGQEPLPVLTAHLEFTNPTGQTVFAADLPPASPDYPSSQWSPNELILFPHSLGLPPDLPAGPVQVTLTLLRPDRTPVSETYALGKLTINVPNRSFSLPPIAHPVQADFNGAVRLLGYDLAADSISLYWQALQPVSIPLTVFVHRFDAQGNFIGGHDSPPARSTTSWLPGEVLVDVHPIAVDDHFEVGLYDSVTGERFGRPFVVKP